MALIHVFDIPQVVQLSTRVVAGTGSNHMNYPINHSDFTLIKGVLNEIDFLVLDIDRKTVSLGEEDAIILRIHRRSDQSVVLTTTLATVEGSQARFRASIPAEVVDDLDNGFYRYTVCLRTGADEPQERLLYTDRGRTGEGSVEVRQGPLPVSTAPRKVERDDMLPLAGSLISGALPGAAQIGNRTGVHTVAVYGNHFTGSVVVEASLEMQPDTNDASWFTVVEHSFSELIGSSGFSFTGPYQWVRFKVTESQPSGGNQDGCAVCTLGDEVGDKEFEWPEGTPDGFVHLLYRN